MVRYYDEDDNYIGDRPERNKNTTGPDMNDIPEEQTPEKPPKKPELTDEQKKENADKRKKTLNKIGNVAGKAADLAGLMAQAHARSWSGLRGGGHTEIKDASKQIAMVRDTGDTLTPAEREKLKKLTGGYGA